MSRSRTIDALNALFDMFWHIGVRSSSISLTDPDVVLVETVPIGSQPSSYGDSVLSLHMCYCPRLISMEITFWPDVSTRRVSPCPSVRPSTS